MSAIAGRFGAPPLRRSTAAWATGRVQLRRLGAFCGRGPQARRRRVPEPAGQSTGHLDALSAAEAAVGSANSPARILTAMGRGGKKGAGGRHFGNWWQWTAGQHSTDDAAPPR